MQWHMPIVSALARVRQEDFREFKPAGRHTKTLTWKERGAGEAPLPRPSFYQYTNAGTEFIAMATEEEWGSVNVL